MGVIIFVGGVFLIIGISSIIQEHLGTIWTTTFLAFIPFIIAYIDTRTEETTNLHYFLYGFAFFIFSAGVLSTVYHIYMDNKAEKKIEDAVKSLQNNYKEGQNPLVVGYTSIYSNQQQTRQLATGALLYSLPKEYSLTFNSRNISPKAILAIEFQVIFLNAFDEVIDILELSSKRLIKSAELYIFNENIDKPINYSSCVTRAKRVKFIDGTIWVNEN